LETNFINPSINMNYAAGKRIILARHGETIANRVGVIQGGQDYPLTDRGTELAKKVARLIEHEQIEAVYTSALGRAVNSARIYSNGRPVPVMIRNTMVELSFGEWEGRRRDEVGNGRPHLRETWFYRPPGGESYSDAEPRVTQFLSEIALNDDAASILVVGHAGVNRVFLKLLLGLASTDAERIVFRHDTIYIIQGNEIISRSIDGSQKTGLLLTP
jgi:broad specificity phosphatase PhoE